MLYEELLQEAEDNTIEVIEFTFESDCMGMLYDDTIALSPKLKTSKERKCILAEELGHYHTTIGNIIDLKNVCNYKQELKARKYAYNKLVPLKSLIEASYSGCTNLYELLEHLDVTEEFLKDALKHYESVYGLFAEVENYCVYFNPLTVCKYNYKKYKE